MPLKIRQRRTTPADFQNFIGKATSGLGAPHSLQAFFDRLRTAVVTGLPVSAVSSRTRSFGGGVVDIERHSVAPWQKFGTNKDKPPDVGLNLPLRETKGFPCEPRPSPSLMIQVFAAVLTLGATVEPMKQPVQRRLAAILAAD